MNQIVKFLRIDDRLIHGQVIVGWIPVLQTKQVLVVNDRVNADPVRQDMMGLSLPTDIELLCKAVSDVGKIMALPKETLVLVSCPKDALACLQNGLFPEVLNIGGLHAKPGKEEILEALHVDEEDRNSFRSIMKLGFMPVFQPTPQNEPLPLGDILK